MTVFVDDMRATYGRLIMCHMIADTEDELHAMAERIGVARRWFQDPRTMPRVSHPHYDIALSKRRLAVSFGAVEVTLRQCALMSAVHARTGRLPQPELAEAEWRRLREEFSEVAE